MAKIIQQHIKSDDYLTAGNFKGGDLCLGMKGGLYLVTAKYNVTSCKNTLRFTSTHNGVKAPQVTVARRLDSTEFVQLTNLD